MEAIVEIFRMSELSPEVRVRAIKKLAQALENQHGTNFTGEVVEELCGILTSESNKKSKSKFKSGAKLEEKIWVLEDKISVLKQENEKLRQAVSTLKYSRANY